MKFWFDWESVKYYAIEDSLLQDYRINMIYTIILQIM